MRGPPSPLLPPAPLPCAVSGKRTRPHPHPGQRRQSGPPSLSGSRLSQGGLPDLPGKLSGRNTPLHILQGRPTKPGTFQGGHIASSGCTPKPGGAAISPLERPGPSAVPAPAAGSETAAAPCAQNACQAAPLPSRQLPLLSPGPASSSIALSELAGQHSLRACVLRLPCSALLCLPACLRPPLSARPTHRPAWRGSFPPSRLRPEQLHPVAVLSPSGCLQGNTAPALLDSIRTSPDQPPPTFLGLVTLGSP